MCKLIYKEVLPILYDRYVPTYFLTGTPKDLTLSNILVDYLDQIHVVVQDTDLHEPYLGAFISRFSEDKWHRKLFLLTVKEESSNVMHQCKAKPAVFRSAIEAVKTLTNFEQVAIYLDALNHWLREDPHTNSFTMLYWSEYLTQDLAQYLGPEQWDADFQRLEFRPLSKPPSPTAPANPSKRRRESDTNSPSKHLCTADGRKGHHIESVPRFKGEVMKKPKRFLKRSML